MPRKIILFVPLHLRLSRSVNILDGCNPTLTDPNMRLRLRIERNGLPSTQVLYPVRDPRSTVAQLLSSINEVFPLECDTWGLEDYSVSISGYECLHYHVLEEVCREDDEVAVKALQYVDVRARTMAGRDQIATDGRHLVDGVPWGRPCLRGPVRPEVRIPPRKKRKLLVNGDALEDAEEEVGPLKLMENGDVDGDEDSSEEDDEDFDLDESEDESASEDSSSDSESADSDDSDSSSDISDSESTSEDTSESDSESEAAESWDGITATPQRMATKSSTNAAATTRPSTTSNAKAGPKRKRQLEDGPVAQGAPDDRSHETKVPKLTTNIPFEGTGETKSRNARRRDAKALKQLVNAGILPEDATLAMARERRNQDHNALNEGAEKMDVSIGAVPNGEDISAGAVTLVEADSDAERDVKGIKKAKGKAKIEQQRQRLLSDIASGGIDVTEKYTRPSSKWTPAVQDEDDEPPQELSSKPPLDVSAQASPASVNSTAVPTIDKPVAMVPPSVARRSKLDLAGSKRLLFGSLGVRVPKTQEERDQLQKKLAERPRKNVFSTGQDCIQVNGGAAGDEAQQEAEQGYGDEDLEAWRKKINLTAIECCDEGVTLSTPPFPFHQRWDPQQKKKKASKRINGTYMDGTAWEKRKRGKQSLEYLEESYDKYNTGGYGDALDYDDAEDGYWEEGALLDEDYVENDEDANEDEDDGFPALPTDVNNLRVMSRDEAQNGDFITFAELACDDTTGWQPKMVRRTAKLVEAPTATTTTDGTDAGHWLIQLSMRDRKVVEYDEEGNRVYKRFDMPGVDDEADGTKSVLWSDLGEVKLVLRPGKADGVAS